MAFFSHGEARNKQMILYLLREIEYPITQNQIYLVFAQQGWMDYFDFQTAFMVLEEDAFVAAIPCAYGDGYCITPHGENTLGMFEKEIPQSIQDDIRDYAKNNRDALRDETQFAAYHTRMPDDSYVAVLRLMDKNAHIVNISMQVPTAEFAQMACDAWPKEAEGVYMELLNRLLIKK